MDPAGYPPALTLQLPANILVLSLDQISSGHAVRFS
jgi:hypothetical protein